MQLGVSQLCTKKKCAEFKSPAFMKTLGIIITYAIVRQD